MKKKLRIEIEIYLPDGQCRISIPAKYCLHTSEQSTLVKMQSLVSRTVKF